MDHAWVIKDGIWLHYYAVELRMHFTNTFKKELKQPIIEFLEMFFFLFGKHHVLLIDRTNQPLTFCLLLLPLWESVIVLCFVVRYFTSVLVLQSS